MPTAPHSQIRENVMDRKANFSKFLGLPVRIFAFGLAALPLGTAWADCKPVIAAYAAADATRHFAIYTVSSITQAPQGEPMRVVLGNTDYLENDVRKGPLQIVKDGYKKTPFVPGFEANATRDKEKEGRSRCEPLGEKNVGAEALIGYRVRSNDKGSAPDPFASEIWINNKTGLPVWSDDGFRWVYGTQVIAPSASQIRQ
jgi:hypothetical protein